MKEFVIVAYRNPYEIAIGRNTRQAEGRVYSYDQQVGSGHGFTSDVYFANTYDDALQACRDLTRNNPGQTYCIAKTSDVFHQPVQSPIHSKFTEKGLLPV